MGGWHEPFIDHFLRGAFKSTHANSPGGVRNNTRRRRVLRIHQGINMQQAMTPPQDMRHKTLKQCLDDAKRNERHNTNAETRYWCDQYKQIATEALATEQRPQNCGTGFCSCIECPYGTQQAVAPVAGGDREVFEQLHERDNPAASFRKLDNGDYLCGITQASWEGWKICAEAAASIKPAPTQQPDEISPEFTDTARAALLWVLWHHQGGSSPVGQPIRFALGMGAHDRLTDQQIREAKRWASLDPKPAHGITAPTIPAPQLEAAQALIDHQAEKTWTDPHAADAKIWRQKGGAA